MIGTTISHYKIIEKLGVGGMGIVYKAEDIRLKRIVALKFLPSFIMASEAEKTRFIHEAQAAAALNHPNICTIYEIDEAEGQQFIAMEFVEGETLQKKVSSDQLSVNSSIDTAIQIAQGLAKAHEHGITHRDIKPANVMITKGGVAKILDFGLAKLAGQSRLTKSGSTLGTMAYMAPEQARGEEVDHRTDIWALGVVIYEMLTGQLPFRGVYEHAMMYSILNEEPEPVQKYRPELSSEFLRVLNRALEKGAADRYQSVSDMLIDLRRLNKETGSVSRRLPGEMKIPESRAAMAAPRSSKKKLWLSLGALAVLAIVVSVLLLPQRSIEVNPNMTFRVLPITLTQIAYPGLSPDGNWLVFPAADANGKWDVYLMNTSGGEPRRVTTDASDYFEAADISPDGAYVIYERKNLRLRKSELRIVSSLGGTSKILINGALPLWRPDGQRIGYIMGHPGAFTYTQSGKMEFWSVKPDGSDNRLEFVDSTIPGFIDCSASYSPDGKSVAWVRTFPERHAEVIVRELESGKERQLTFDKKRITEVCWTPNDQIIFSSNKSGNTNLWMVPATGGQALQITKGSGPDFGMRISAHGKKLVYLHRQEAGYLWLAKIDGSNARQITFDERKMWNPFFSPDGQRLLICMGDPDYVNFPVLHLYAINRDGSNRQQITSAELAAVPRWSPDGRWIVYSAIPFVGRSDSTRVYLVEASNPGNPRLLGRGFTVCWIDAKSFIVRTMSNTWLLFVDGTAPRRLSEDSTFAIPVFGEKDALLPDLRKGREGWWMAPMAGWRAPATRPPKKILELGSRFRFTLAPSREFLYYVKNGSSDFCVHDLTAIRKLTTFPQI